MLLLQKSQLFLLFQFIAYTLVTSDSPSPYCYRNKTEVTYKLVTKTRIKTVNSKGVFKKIFNKKETQVEIYEDQEPVLKIKAERYCCEGYKLSQLDLCEPQCLENGCPAHSKCVEPEVCECVRGYFSKRSDKDNKHYCEPICEKACPENSACVGPNECACMKGYQVSEDLECKPYCASGCPHGGECIKPNVCSCSEGYKSERGSCLPNCSQGFGWIWNPETKLCEPGLNDNDTEYSSTFEPVSEETSEPIFEVETDIDTTNDAVDPNQVFDEIIDSTTFSYTEEYDSSTLLPASGNKCPDDYVFHNGQCSPLKFVSNEIDCLLKPCEDKNAVCLENGTCACNEGFKWFKAHVVDANSLNQTIKAVCLSLADYESKLQQLKEDPSKTAVREPITAASIFFIIMGVLVIMGAFVFLLYKLVFTQRGELDVEGKF